MLDAMPNDAAILGFENRWQSEAVARAATVTLPSEASSSLAFMPWLRSPMHDDAASTIV